MVAEVTIEECNLINGQSAAGWVTGDLREAKWDVLRRVCLNHLAIVFTVMTHEHRILQGIPVNAVVDDVVDRFVGGRLDDMGKSAGAMLGDAEHKHFVRRGGLLASDVQTVSVPDTRPFLSVLVNRMKEEVVYEPDVIWVVSVQAVVMLQLEEEGLPLAAEADRDIKPQSLDASIVHAPGGKG